MRYRQDRRRVARIIGTALALAVLAAMTAAQPAAAAAIPTVRVSGQTLIIHGSGTQPDSITLRREFVAVGVVGVSVSNSVPMLIGPGCTVQFVGRAICVPAVAGQDFSLLQIRLHGGNDVLRISDDVRARADVQGQDGNDDILGTLGADRLDGGPGDDRIRGDAGNDELLGSGGRDRLDGGDGDDTLKGGVNDDILRGDADDDTLIGYLGKDTLIGGGGLDAFDGGVHNDTVISADDVDEPVDCGGGADDFARFNTGDILASCERLDRV